MRRRIRSGENVTNVVIRAVADVTDRDPLDLQPLGDSIDADAVDALFVNSADDSVESLTIHYGGCRVTIDGEAVTVEDEARTHVSD